MTDRLIGDLDEAIRALEKSRKNDPSGFAGPREGKRGYVGDGNQRARELLSSLEGGVSRLKAIIVQ